MIKHSAVFLISLFLLTSFDSYGQSLLELLKKDNLTISSHRGVSALGEEENSIRSLTKSLSEGIKLHEIDIMESQDGKLYLLHDETLDRTTNLNGKIRETHSSVLDQAVLLETNEPLPTFMDVLDWAKENGAYLMLDVKAATVDKVMAEVQKAGMMERVMLLTFSRERTKEALNYPEPFLISALIEDKGDIDHFLNLFTEKDFLIGYINKTADIHLYAAVREAGITIITDTMGDLDNKALQDKGKPYVDFIRSRKPDILVSDYPMLLNQALKMHF